MAVTLTACVNNGPEFTPQPVETITPSATPRTPSVPATPTATPTPGSTQAPPASKATGSLALFAPVTTVLAGRCETKSGAPTVTLADHKNDFYGTVDVTLVLKSGKAAVDSVDITFGEDSEGFTWKLSYDSAAPAAGTSAKLAVSGSTYKVSGKVKALETRKGKKLEEVLPFTLVAKCAGSQW